LAIASRLGIFPFTRLGERRALSVLKDRRQLFD
jgi:hypothetical protein